MYFTDAVFAIAMTLLVVEIGVPETIEGAPDDPAALLGAFADKGPLLFAFFLGCYVIGFYWAAHHRFMSWLDAVDRGFVLLTVVYLAFVALLPFPTGVLGEFGENPISVVAFAVNMGAVSGMETVLFSHARRRRLFREELPEDVYRWALGSSLLPVLGVRAVDPNRLRRALAGDRHVAAGDPAPAGLDPVPAGGHRSLPRLRATGRARPRPPPAARPAGRC
jgi:uncharacterized membrane protein